jgi:chaperonin GroEL
MPYQKYSNLNRKKKQFGNVMKKFSFISALETNFQTISEIYDSMKIVLGPTGKNGIYLTKESQLKFLTSGSMLLKSLEFSENSSNVLLKLFEQAAIKTFQISGDGSTTTTLFSSDLLKTCFKFILNGYNPIFLSNGLKKLAYLLVEKVIESSSPVNSLSQLKGILRTAIGKKVNRELAQCLESFLPSIRRDGLIFVEENISDENQIEIVEGIQLDRGFASSYFVNNFQTFEVVYENPYVLVTSQPISSLNQIREILEYVKETQKSLVIVAEEISQDVLSTLVLNNIQRKLKVVVIKYTAIQFLKTGILEDLAILTHANYIVPISKKNIEPLTIKDLGQAEKIVIQKEKSTFFFSKFSKVIAKRRINELNRELLTSESEEEKGLLKTRIARLSGNIMKVKVGISNQYEISEQRQKIENSIQTLRSSLEEGVLPGGGSFYLSLRSELSNWSNFNLIGEEIYACNILSQSLLKPFQELSSNNNIAYWFFFEEISRQNYTLSYDLLEKKLIHQTEQKILDSAKSVRSILWNSLTIVSTILTSE